MAIFSSHCPAVIGPVRSARQDDLQLLRQFGRPGFAYSGAPAAAAPVSTGRPDRDLYAGTAGGYFRDWNRVAPYNLYAYPRAAGHRGQARARRMTSGSGSARAPPGGRARRSVSVSYPASSFTFTWSAAEGPLAGVDGRHPRGQPAGRAAFRRHRGDPAHDGAHLPVPGAGPPAALRAEHRVRPRAGAAERPRLGRALVAARANDGTTFTTAAGGPMTFARGQVWIVLAYP